MIHWNLNPQQADQVLNALAMRPYAEVHALIAELLKQANPPAPMPPPQYPMDEND